MNHERGVSFSWCLVRDRDTWAIRYRWYDVDKKKKCNRSKALGFRCDEMSREDAEILAHELVKVIDERHREYIASRVGMYWESIFNEELTVSDESKKKAAQCLKPTAIQKADIDLATAYARFFESKSLHKTNL